MRISDWSSDVCSSDLRERQLALAAIAARFGQQAFDALAPVGVEPAFNGLLAQMAAAGTGNVVLALGQFRSEEHTSELQSLVRISYAVFCCKKKKQATQRMRSIKKDYLRRQNST